MAERIKTAVIGVGHLGQHHARIYKELPESELVAVCDEHPENGPRVAQRLNVPWIKNPLELIGKVDAVSIATPTWTHLKVATPFIEHGIPCLIEKPMTVTLDEADKLIALSKEKKTLIQVGHIERFNPVLVAIAPYLDNPRYIESTRISVFPFRSADVGVVMDVMIHDIDLVLEIIGDQVERLDAMGMAVLGKSEDMANARLEFANGSVAHITASRLAAQNERMMRIYQNNLYITLDLVARRAMIFRRSEMLKDKDFDIRTMTPAVVGPDLRSFLFTRLIEVEEVGIEEFEPLKRELQAFLTAVREKETPVVSAEHGRRAIEVAQRIIDRIQSRPWKML